MKNEAAILHEISLFVKATMQNNDSSHDFSHVERVLRMACHLCKEYEDVDVFLTQCISLLHDINDDKLASRVSFDSLEVFLLKVGLSQEKTQFILDGINAISFRKQPALPADAPMEVKIVQDADRLDAIGAIGIARAFAFAGSKGRSIGSDAPKSPIRHFDEKLFLIFDLLNTEEAKAIGKRRALFLHTFYEEFMEELRRL